MNLTSNKLNKIVGYPVKKSKGVFTIGKPYFYRTTSLQSFKESVIEKLSSAGLDYIIIDHGDTWKPFKGGANLWSQSHYWIKLEVKNA